MNKNVYFIAEIGQNHQGDFNIAKKMVDSLKGLPISCIKTAKRDIETCLTDEQKNMIYDNPNSFGKTYYEHRNALELSHDHFIELKDIIRLADRVGSNPRCGFPYTPLAGWGSIYIYQ